MAKTIRDAFAVLLTALLALALPAPATVAASGEPEELVVTLEPGASINDVNGRHETETIENMRGTQIFRVRARRGGTLDELRKDPAVRKAGKDGRIKRHQGVAFPNDRPEILSPSGGQDAYSLYRSQVSRGPLAALGVDAANSLLGASEEVTIAVVDTGIDASHPSVRGHLWEGPGGAIGYDFLDGDPDPDESGDTGPVAGHGTFIAGLIALAAPKVRIMPLRVLSGEGTGSAFDAAEAINYAAQNGAQVISMSFGTEGPRVPHVLRDAIRSAYDRGVVLVAAAGNDAEKAVPYPASDDRRVIAVGACGYDSQAGFSNYGRHVDISAPGVGLVSAMPGTYPEDGRSYRYARWSGTSFSTGLVSAACAVLLATEGVGQPEEVFRRIQENGDDLEGGSRVGKRINFLEAVGSVFREAGALDIWSTANLWSAEDEEYSVGHVVLRTIDDVERLTVNGWSVEPLAEHGLYLLTADREFAAGRAVADAFGSLTLVLSGAPGAFEQALPVPLREIVAVELRDPAGGVVCRAAVAPDAPGLQSWAGVGMKAPGGGEAFGWAWYSLEWPSAQRISVALCALEEGATYVLRVNGNAVARQTLPVGVEPSVTFWFSNYDCDLQDGAEPLPDVLAPVTRTGLAEVWKVDGGGETLVASGDFSGAAKHMPGAR